jgi:hypothetical protein
MPPRHVRALGGRLWDRQSERTAGIPLGAAVAVACTERLRAGRGRGCAESQRALGWQGPY